MVGLTSSIPIFDAFEARRELTMALTLTLALALALTLTLTLTLALTLALTIMTLTRIVPPTRTRTLNLTRLPSALRSRGAVIDEALRVRR